MSKNQYQIEYKKIGAKYYLNKVGNDASLHFKSDRNHYNFKADTRVDYIINSNQFDSVASFSNEETLKKGRLTEEQNSNLDPNFWLDYTIILPTHDFAAIAKTLAANNEANDFKIRAEDFISKLPKNSELRIDSLLQFFNDRGLFNGNALIHSEGKTLLNKSYNSKLTNNLENSQFRIGSLKFKPRVAYTDWDAFYGYGWMIDDFKFLASKKHNIIYHPGTDLGFYTMFLKEPDLDLTIILLNNTGEFPRYDMTDLILVELN